MNPDCSDFLDRLADHLRGRGNLTALAWHEHLLGCAACRDLLESEEALEELLATLPEPRLPAELAERVLARLEARRELASRGSTADLDRLLELQTVDPPPADLALRVHAGLALARAETGLDRLLDRVPAPTPPAGLARRTLAALESRRERAQPSAPMTVSGTRAALSRTWILRAAAAVLIAGAGWWLWTAFGARADRVPPLAPAPVARGAPTGHETEQDSVEEDLLAALDVLESWELVSGEDLEVLLSSLDPVDEVLLELELDSSSSGAGERTEGETGGNG